MRGDDPDFPPQESLARSSGPSTTPHVPGATSRSTLSRRESTTSNDGTKVTYGWKEQSLCRSGREGTHLSNYKSHNRLHRQEFCDDTWCGTAKQWGLPFWHGLRQIKIASKAASVDRLNPHRYKEISHRLRFFPETTTSDGGGCGIFEEWTKCGHPSVQHAISPDD